MIRKELIDYLAEKLQIGARELIEKDLILHRILVEMVSNSHFAKNYTFKGGTCLMKCYLGYYRFSEDLDFTWIEQDIFKEKSGKQLRAMFSKEISSLAKLLESIAEKLELRFKADKTDRNYIELGRSNAQATFKLWYQSQEMGKEGFIKLQNNYREILHYKPKNILAKSIINKELNNEILPLFPEESEWLLKEPKILVYDLREILIEKVRAILTRRGVKARDFVDLYWIEKQQNLKAENLETQVLEKINSMLKFEKYKINLKTKIKELPTFKLGEEEKLVLKPLGDDFPEFVKRLEKFFEKILRSLKKNNE